MAHAGLFVPAAAGSRLPLLGAVLVDIGDEQSIDRDLSTFTGHVENLARIAPAAGPGTLVLLDEPGAGTDPIEGAALAVGVLTDLLARGPRVVFTSHFPQVKTFALAEPAFDVAASRRFVRELETRGRAVLDELRRRPEPAALRSFVREASDAIAAHAPEAEPARTPGRPPVPGDLVEIAGRGIRGELVELEGE